MLQWFLCVPEVNGFHHALPLASQLLLLWWSATQTCGEWFESKYFLRQVWWGFCSEGKVIICMDRKIRKTKQDKEILDVSEIPKHFTLHRVISRLCWWAPGISEITAWLHICIYQKLVHEVDPTTVLKPASQQMLFAFEMQLIIRILGSCPHFCSCRSSQEHTAHEDPLVAYQLSFAINIVLPSVPSTHQIYSRFNLSFNWHEVSWTLAGRELQCLTAVSYFWAGSSRFALKLITSVSVSFKLFLLASEDF